MMRRIQLILITLFYFLNSFTQTDLEVIIQTGHAGKINSLLFNQENTKFYSAGKDSKIILWDIKTGKQEQEVIAHKGAVNKLEFYNDSVLISCSDDKTIKLWSTKDLELIQTIGPFEFAVKSIDVNNLNHNIVAGTRFLHLIDSTFKITTLKTISQDYFDAVHYLDEPGYIIYGGRSDKFTKVIEENSLDIIKNITINATSINSYGNEYVIGDLHGSLFYYNMRNRTEKRYSLESPLIAINGIDIYGNKIIFARSDGIVEEINIENFSTYNYYKGHLSEVTDVNFGKDKNFFISSDYEGNIILWNSKAKLISKVYQGEANPINVCKFSESEEELIIGYSNGILRAINLISNNVISNRLYFDQDKKLKGWKYSIISLDEQIGDILKFQALKTKTFDENTNNLTYCEIWSGEWDLVKNKIDLKKQIRKEESKKLIADQSLGKEIVWQTYFLDPDNLQESTKNSSRQLRVNENYIEIYDQNSQEVKNRVLLGHNDLVTGIDYNQKFDIVVTYSWDGSIKFWDTNELINRAQLYLFGQRDFLWLNPESYYFSSKGALEFVAFSWDGMVFPFDQFDVKYNRPDLIYEHLPFLEPSMVVEMHKAYNKRLKTLGLTIEDIKITSDLPVIKVDIPDEIVTKSDQIIVQCKASHASSPIVAIKVYVNGVPLIEEAPEINPKQLSLEMAIVLPLSPGDNQIEIYALSENQLKSLKESFIIVSKVKEEKPDLYIVTIGVSNYAQKNFNLNYAAKDSKDIVDKLSTSKLYKNIYTKNLKDEEATYAKISTITDFVRKAKYNDVVIVFAAGHGVLDENLDYYFAAHDMDFYKPADRGVPFIMFEEILEATKSRKKLLLLDACHSGEVDKDEVEITETITESGEDITFRAAGADVSNKSGSQVSSFQYSRMLFADTRESNGSTVISSASGTEYAIEGKNWNNGVFTFSFINGINTKSADLNRDGMIMLSEMQTYINIKVLELTKGKQNPNSRVENLKSDFRLW